MNGLERSMTTVQRVDVSPSHHGTSAAPASRVGIRQDHRWQSGRREEPCACGGVLVQYLNEPVQEIVYLHNLSTQHQQWRARQA